MPAKTLSTAVRIAGEERNENSSARLLRPGPPERRCVEMGAHPVERLGVGALERVDRLLLVADDEDRAGNVVAGAAPGGELGREALDHRPLLGGGVLGLVHQDVVDPAVEPVEHPVGQRRVGQAGRAP